MHSRIRFSFQRTRARHDSKQVLERVCDFINFERFTLFVNQFAVSLAHRDLAGVMTVARCEKRARKYWMMWPYMDEEELVGWQSRCSYSPNQVPFTVVLEEGDRLSYHLDGCSKPLPSAMTTW